MTGELLHAIAQVQKPKVCRPDIPATSGHHKLASTLKHVLAHIIQVRTGHTLRPTDANIVSGVGAITARPMGAQEVIPTIAIEQSSRFTVNCHVDWLVAFHTFARARIKFDNADVAEVS